MSVSTASRPLIRTYDKVKARISARVGRDWQPGDRLPPISDLATEMKVGRTTAFRAVRELVAEGVLVSAPKLGTFVSDLGAQAVNPAQAPRSAAHGKQIVLLSTSMDAFISVMAQSFSDAMTEQGGHVRRVVIPSTEIPIRLERYFSALPYAEADAIVMVNGPRIVPAVSDPRQLLLYISTGAGQRVAMPGCYDIVSVEHEQGAALAGARFRALGCESVFYVGVRGEAPDIYDQTSTLRLRGLEHGWGRELPAEHCCVARWYDIVEAAEIASRWVVRADRPGNVFAASDELAIGFTVGAAAHGLVAGRDFRIIGFDGQFAARNLRGGPLTTVAVPTEEMGSLGARLLVSRFEQPDRAVRRVALGCTLLDGVTA